MYYSIISLELKYELIQYLLFLENIKLDDELYLNFHYLLIL